MQATMLIGGVVSDWVEIEIKESIQPHELDRMIGEIARRHGLNIDRPFPLVVDGQLSDVHVHIINGVCPVHSRRNNLVIPQSQQPFDWLADELPGRVVGIFATNAAGRMTHPGSNVHAHLIFEVKLEKTATGHLEQFGIKAGSTLKFPKMNNQ